jgi:uncharacterized SAM-binding protein YcdF (DUF218 family)
VGVAHTDTTEATVDDSPVREPDRHPWRTFGRLVAVVIIAAILYVAFSFAQVLYAARLVQDRRVQAIVVLGAAQYNGVPSPDLASRLSHALVLWRRHLAPLIVVTGGKEPGDVYTEAEAGAMYLAARGVPQANIVRVVQGRDTWQSFTAVEAVLDDRHISRVLLVSDPFHDERIRLMAGDVGLTPSVSPTHTSPIRGVHVIPYYLKETAEVAVGRIIGFRRLSEITHG